MSGTAIREAKGWEVLDSRGNPTVAAEVVLEGGARGQSAVPSGASTGEHEAVELRDGDGDRYLGKGVTRAVGNLNGPIAEAVRGRDAADQEGLDRFLVELDGTPNKGRLGANAILAVSMAAARATAAERGVPLYRHLATLWGGEPELLPVPQMNILNGGEHASNSVDIQEFMVMPVGFDRFSEALRAGVEVFHNLKAVLSERGHGTAVGDEGGFAPDLGSNEEAVEVLLLAVERAGYAPGRDVVLALDAAASELHENGEYVFRWSGGERRDAGEMVDFWRRWAESYPIHSVEDPLDEDDWEGWGRLTREVGDGLQIVGDDLFVTNPERLRRGVEEGVANALLVKVNQIGTLTETLEAMRMSEEAGYRNVVSHRSGETEDTFIADLAVATGAGQIKTGSASRTDRVAKYNRLLRIEDELGPAARYRGRELAGS